MPSDNVITIRTPICMLYLVRGNDGYMLVDAGTWGHYWPIRLALWRNGIKPSEVRCVVATHEHPDHVGVLGKLQAKHGWTVICHADGVDAIREGRVIIPETRNRLGRFCAGVGRCIRWLLCFRAMEPDMVVSGDTSLEPFGVAGQLVHTPGHSEGSMSVVLDSGEAIVGDLMGDRILPAPGPPLFGYSLDVLYES
ncbi:MAG TPA: MBL fold metallo-hydrolase, partial [Armatimonadota bacterium]|nr:MBL fold metallo-hydrolase [Armatimonadota bacterium]